MLCAPLRLLQGRPRALSTGLSLARADGFALPRLILATFLGLLCFGPVTESGDSGFDGCAGSSAMKQNQSGQVEFEAKKLCNISPFLMMLAERKAIPVGLLHVEEADLCGYVCR